MILGISGKTLSHKLGIKQGHIVTLIHAPEEYGTLLFPIPPDCSIYDTLIEPSDFIQFFAKDKKELQTMFPKLLEKRKSDGTLCICWPKTTKSIVFARSETTKQSHSKSDLDEHTIREIGEAYGLIGKEVIVIDETWSGIPFVHKTPDNKID